MSGPGLSFITNFLQYHPKVSESLNIYDSHDTYVGKQYKRLQYTHHKTPIDDEIFLRSSCNIGDMEGCTQEKMQSILSGISYNDFSELNQHMLKGQEQISPNLYECEYNTFQKMDCYHNQFRRIPVRGNGGEDNINVVEGSSIVIYSYMLQQLLCFLGLIILDVKTIIAKKNQNKTQSQGGKSGQTKAQKSKNRPVNDDMLQKTATTIKALSQVVDRSQQQEKKYVKNLFKNYSQEMVMNRQRVGDSARMKNRAMKFSDFEKYRRMVLSPFDSEGVRGPSKFFQPTSMLTYKLEHDFKPGTSDAAICVLPQAFGQQQVANGFAFYNANKDVIPGVTQSYSYVGTTPVQPNQVYVHPLAGGGSVNNSPVDQSTTSFSDSSKRWLTARCNALGIRIIPTGSSIGRAGVLTLGILPGKSQASNSTSITVPSPTALRQYPTSYEVSVQNIPQTGTDLIWIPLDPSDDIFKCGQSNLANDDMSREAFYSGQCWILINGINQGGTTTDAFRVEVVTHIEYIPTLPFSTWSPSSSTKVTQNQFGSLLSEIAQCVPQVIDGEIGRKLSGGLEVGRKIYETMKLASVLM